MDISPQRVLFKSPSHVFDSELPDLLIAGAGVEFSGKVWRSLCEPCVYIASSRKEVLYVGLSQNGLTRPFDTLHHKLGGSQRNEVTKLKVYPCKSLDSARKAERILIAALNPKWNERQTVAAKYRTDIAGLIEAMTA